MKYCLKCHMNMSDNRFALEYGVCLGCLTPAQFRELVELRRTKK